jgi:hypothetical protein
MKKWHIEEIISVTDSTSQKLIVPDSNRMYLWTTAFTHQPRKEFFLISFLRNVVTFFLRGI